VRFRIVTYNIHRAIGVDRRFRPQRIVEILTHHGPDLILLQEVDEGVPRSRELHLARELADALGFEHFAMGHNVSLRKGKYGNATLSRHPIVRERNIDLTVGHRKRRGCQHTTIEVSGERRQRRLEVFNAHLGLSARERDQQARLLLRSPEFKNLSRQTPCLLGGDLNDWRAKVDPFVKEKLGFRSATSRRRGISRSIPTYPSFAPQGGLDRLYYRGPLRLVTARACRLSLSKVASDHLPIVADFELG
jgi:endonuclease/exonuclease/phosphatase family metal-dependent hydrolase